MTSVSFPHPIVLVGLMGVGKSTVGKALAERLEYRFLDNDAGIETEYGATVGELGDRFGIEEAHRIEADQLLQSLAHFGDERLVIAAAASVVEDAECRRALTELAVVWLRADAAYLAGRLRPTDHRPVFGLHPEQLLVRQSATRDDLYRSTSTVVVEVAGRSVSAIVEEIMEGLRDESGSRK